MASWFRLVACTPPFHYASHAATATMQASCQAQRKPFRNQNRTKHCSPWSLSPGNSGTNGITVAANSAHIANAGFGNMVPTIIPLGKAQGGCMVLGPQPYTRSQS